MLNMSKVELDLIPDPDMHLFFEQGISGEVSYNLYGCDFKWIDPKEFAQNKYTSNRSKGCVLKVDLEIPKELCQSQNDYPLAPDKIEIKKEVLSTNDS